MLRPSDALDPRQRVALGVSALHCARRQVDRHARVGQLIARRVCSALRLVAAVEHVRARAALQVVGSVTAQERVVALATPKVVAARSPVQYVITLLTPQDAAFRREGLRIRVIVPSREHVGVVGPTDAFDPPERVTLGVPARRRARRQIDRHAGIGLRVPGRVAPDDVTHGCRTAEVESAVLAAMEHIRARAAFQEVVSVTAKQAVVRAVAEDSIVEAGAPHVLDLREHIALGMPAAAGRAIEVDTHALGGFRVVGDVGARPAVQRIGSCAPFEPVVAGQPHEVVVADTAPQNIVAARTAEDIVCAGATDDRHVLLLSRAVDVRLETPHSTAVEWTAGIADARDDQSRIANGDLRRHAATRVAAGSVPAHPRIGRRPCRCGPCPRRLRRAPGRQDAPLTLRPAAAGCRP